MQFKALKVSHLKWEIQADATLQPFAEMHWTRPENIVEVQQRQRKNVGGKDNTFDIGDTMWLLNKHFRTTRPSQKLDSNCAEQYTLSKVINRNA
jgi:hypothetical protein